MSHLHRQLAAANFIADNGTALEAEEDEADQADATLRRAAGIAQARRDVVMQSDVGKANGALAAQLLENSTMPAVEIMKALALVPAPGSGFP